ncbi:hypothetical protein ACP3WC_24300, partial [Salmonella enterica]
PLDDESDTRAVAGRIPIGDEVAAEEVVSQELRDAVAGGTGQYWQSVGFTRDGVEVPGVIFGTQVTLPSGDIMGLYFLYD